MFQIIAGGPYASNPGNNMSEENSKIIYTLTDEAPLLATYSLLPIVEKFTSAAGIDIIKSDISVAARLLAEFPDYLTEEQQHHVGIHCPPCGQCWNPVKTCHG